jgi:hypothetical protein
MKDADLFLIECGSVTKDPPAEATWRLIGEGKKLREGRPKEIFRLFHLTGASEA